MTSMPLILAIPDIALEKILSFLSYDEIAKNRLVCTKFNQIGGKLLTRGFLQVERRHNAIYKRMKSMLPRRESERRAHPLARHCDILSAVETRLSMLSMTYMKYMGSNVCCFIPGKVLDEIDRILTLVENVDPPPRTHELLQELRDISSMALEHFDEVILPRLKPKFERSNFFQVGASTSKSSKIPLVQQVIADEIHKVRKQAKFNKHQISSVMEILKKFGTKFKRQSKLLREKSIKIREQERKLQEQAAKLQEQETSIADLKKHVDEWDQKFSDLTAELIRAREDLISKSVQPPVSNPLPRSEIITRPIRVKPRSALPKYFNLPHVDIERKRKNEPFSDIPYKMPRVTGLTSNISDDIYNKINENITCNISKNITDSLNKANESGGSQNISDTREKGFVSKKEGFGPFLSSSIEMILNTPINSIKSRKRKISEDIDLK
ncbi:hypothetical protein ILUMI_10952 [Ignelater luminosus]|uniref:F-box domain-containing protein n=1 Tax=Ignelater luminosus TaxID=2038154 RepID=A0A8K0CWY6_IGNLU|nr:hypothetical protein ILUMI_10952 [Ignelater luminosus]